MNVKGLRYNNFALILIFVVSTSLIFFMMGLAYKQLQQLSGHTSWVYHSQKVSLKLEQLYSAVKDIESERRDYVISGDPVHAELIVKRVEELQSIQAALRSMIRDNPEQTKNFRQLEWLVADKYRLVTDALRHPVTDQSPIALRKMLMQGTSSSQKIRNKIHLMHDAEDVLLRHRHTEFLFSEKSAPIYLYAVSLFSLATLSFAFYKIFGDLRLQRKSNISLNLSANISDFAQNISKFGTWTFNPDTRHLEFSDNEKKILGFGTGSLVKNRNELFNRIHPDDRQRFTEYFRSWQQGDETAPMVARYVEQDGSIRYLKNITKLITTLNGEKKLLGITSDITDETTNRINLESLAQELRWYNASSKDAEIIGKFGFMRWPAGGGNTKLFMSDNVYRIYGYKPEEKADDVSFLRSAIHKEDLPLLNSKLSEFESGKDSVSPFTMRIYRRDNGKMRYVRSSNRLTDDEKTGKYYLLIIRDITDEVIAQHEFEDKNRALEANNQELQAFNYVASHDLQEPLRKIETFISRLIDSENDTLSETGKSYLEKTRHSASRMRTLIDDLLLFSRSTRSGSTFEITDLNAIIEEVKDELYTRIEEKNAQITVAHLPIISAIPFQIKQLFLNIISNSLKYSRDHVQPVITITCDKVNAMADEHIITLGRGNYYRIIFTDNGIGFDNAYSEKIFQLFNRLHHRKDYEGTGIGLAICRKIVENHQGFIFAEGQVNAGAKFSLYLPFA